MIVGIDLGTTNSLVGIWRDGISQLIPNSLGDFLTPSCVSLGDDGTVIVGQAARDRLLSHSDRTAATFKRYMGTTRETRLGSRKFRPEELSAFVLRALKADAEAYIGHPVTEAVITVPAYFSDAQRKATKAAGELAGLKVERLLNEPTAAALAYGLWENRDGGKYMVIDLGGGTFDVSLLEVFNGVVEVRATAGDNYLGGEDFLDAIVAEYMNRVGKTAGLPPVESNHPAHQILRRQAELAKRLLSDQDSAEISVRWNDALVSWTISRDTFAMISDTLLQRMRAPIVRTLRDARIEPEQLDQVILAGGATRMPMVRRMISLLFGRLPSANIDPDQVVGRGAAVQAGLKMDDKALNEVVLTDVAPYTMGIAISRKLANGERISGLYMPIIERNTVVPVSKSSVISTAQDFQKVVSIEICQGESRLSKDNIPLGKLAIGIPERPEGQESVDVRFTYDVNGLLEVEATVVSTGVSKSIVIEENPGVLTAEEISERFKALAKLKLHPREDDRNIAVLARVDRLYEELLGAEREQISSAAQQFQLALEHQDLKEVEATRILLEQFLDKIEGQTRF